MISFAQSGLTLIIAWADACTTLCKGAVKGGVEFLPAFSIALSAR